MGVFRCEEGHRLVPSFCNPFDIAMTWVAMLVHCDYMSLNGDAVKEFLDVITECRNNGVRELLSIFKEHDVVQREVVK